MLPYSLIELINQLKFNMTLNNILQYLTYIRYLFYCSKFYLIFMVNIKFRREFFKMFRFKNKRNSIMHIDNNLEVTRTFIMQRNQRVKREMFQRMFSSKRKLCKQLNLKETNNTNV